MHQYILKYNFFPLKQYNKRLGQICRPEETTDSWTPVVLLTKCIGKLVWPYRTDYDDIYVSH